MDRLTIYKDHQLNATLLDNAFIDHYMMQANEIQLKIYLYIVRMTGANLPFNIPSIADLFNYPERDIERALVYWEQAQLLSLDYDSTGAIKALHILPIPSPQPANTANIVALDAQLNRRPTMVVTEDPVSEPAPVAKKSYSGKELTALTKDNNDVSTILMVAEQYIGKPLSRKDQETLLYIYDGLEFSVDLIDYLIQYCVENGHRAFSYIEKVALNWSQSEIETVEEAKLHVSNYNATVSAVMNSLGESHKPTKIQIDFVQKWEKEWMFRLPVILKACEKTVLSTDKNRFHYCDKILSSWLSQGIKTVDDVDAADRLFAEKKKAGRKTSDKKTGDFNKFEQRQYDYDELEKLITSN
ncbi:MAG: DnaD domain protein [Lachnospiraceae bacterium]|nr:DnaD domain protein [Lachnospiraceae bacterium]